MWLEQSCASSDYQSASTDKSEWACKGFDLEQAHTLSGLVVFTLVCICASRPMLMMMLVLMSMVVTVMMEVVIIWPRCY